MGGELAVTALQRNNAQKRRKQQQITKQHSESNKDTHNANRNNKRAHATVTYMRRISEPHCQFDSYAYAPDAAVMSGSSLLAITHTRR